MTTALYDARAATTTTSADDRHQRLLALMDDLQSRGLRVALNTPDDGCWSLTVGQPGQRFPRRRVSVWCAGLDGSYVFVTGSGRILGPAGGRLTETIGDQLLSLVGRPPQ